MKLFFTVAGRSCWTYVAENTGTCSASHLFALQDCNNFNDRAEWKQHRKMGVPTDSSVEAALPPSVSGCYRQKRFLGLMREVNLPGVMLPTLKNTVKETEL